MSITVQEINTRLKDNKLNKKTQQVLIALTEFLIDPIKFVLGDQSTSNPNKSLDNKVINNIVSANQQENPMKNTSITPNTNEDASSNISEKLIKSIGNSQNTKPQPMHSIKREFNHQSARLAAPKFSAAVECINEVNPEFYNQITKNIKCTPKNVILQGIKLSQLSLFNNLQKNQMIDREYSVFKNFMNEMVINDENVNIAQFENSLSDSFVQKLHNIIMKKQNGAEYMLYNSHIESNGKIQSSLFKIPNCDQKQNIQGELTYPFLFDYYFCLKKDRFPNQEQQKTILEKYFSKYIKEKDVTFNLQYSKSESNFNSLRFNFTNMINCTFAPLPMPKQINKEKVDKMDDYSINSNYDDNREPKFENKFQDNKYKLSTKTNNLEGIDEISMNLDNMINNISNEMNDLIKEDENKNNQSKIHLNSTENQIINQKSHNQTTMQETDNQSRPLLTFSKKESKIVKPKVVANATGVKKINEFDVNEDNLVQLFNDSKNETKHNKINYFDGEADDDEDLENQNINNRIDKDEFTQNKQDYSTSQFEATSKSLPNNTISNSDMIDTFTTDNVNNPVVPSNSTINKNIMNPNEMKEYEAKLSKMIDDEFESLDKSNFMDDLRELDTHQSLSISQTPNKDHKPQGLISETVEKIQVAMYQEEYAKKYKLYSTNELKPWSLKQCSDQMKVDEFLQYKNIQSPVDQSMENTRNMFRFGLLTNKVFKLYNISFQEETNHIDFQYTIQGTPHFFTRLKKGNKVTSMEVFWFQYCYWRQLNIDDLIVKTDIKYFEQMLDTQRSIYIK